MRFAIVALLGLTAAVKISTESKFLPADAALVTADPPAKEEKKDDAAKAADATAEAEKEVAKEAADKKGKTEGEVRKEQEAKDKEAKKSLDKEVDKLNAKESEKCAELKKKKEALEKNKVGIAEELEKRIVKDGDINSVSEKTLEKEHGELSHAYAQLGCGEL